MSKVRRYLLGAGAGLWLTAQAQGQATNYTLHTFTKIQLTDKFWSEAAAVGDINRDGHTDIVTGPYWYEGPKFTTRHTYYPATRRFTLTTADGRRRTIEGFDGALGSGKLTFAEHDFVAVSDLNSDHWPDILVHAFTNITATDELPWPKLPKTAAYWYENPGSAVLRTNVPWKRHIIAADDVDNESLAFVDLFHDGKPVFLAMSGERAGYFSPNSNNPTQPWPFHPISERSDDFEWYTHGLGYGDLNGDGRNDLLHSDGWWAQPASRTDAPMWQHHPYPFHYGPGQVKLHAYGADEKFTWNVDVDSTGVPEWTHVSTFGGSQMHVYDVNGDGLADIITSLTAHKYGLAWWEQFRDTTGRIQFRRHLITNAKPSESKYGLVISQMQAVEVVDIDGDGLKDIVTGKRFWAHGDGSDFPKDPDSNAPAVLYWFKLVRHPDGSVEFVPYLIDDNSGAGTQLTVRDVDADRRPDIVVANKKGAFVFLQRVTKVDKAAWERAQPKPWIGSNSPTTSSSTRASSSSGSR